LASKSGDDKSDSFCNTNSLIKKKLIVLITVK
jgi:hypothetical protein